MAAAFLTLDGDGSGDEAGGDLLAVLALAAFGDAAALADRLREIVGSAAEVSSPLTARGAIMLVW